MMAQYEGRPGKHEKEMQKLPRKPPKPPKRATERSQDTKIPDGTMPRRLLPPGWKSIPPLSRRIYIVANSTRMRKRRNGPRTERAANRGFHQLGNTGNTGNGWWTTVHSTHDPGIPETMGSAPQDHFSIQPTRQPKS